MTDPSVNSASAESQEQEITPEDKCQALVDSVTDMRVRYPAYIARLDEKIVKINLALFKKRLKAHRDVKFKTPKYTNDVNLNLQDFEKLKKSFAQQRETIKKLKTLREVANQIRNDRVGKILREDVDTKTLLGRVQQKIIDKKLMENGNIC